MKKSSWALFFFFVGLPLWLVLQDAQERAEAHALKQATPVLSKSAPPKPEPTFTTGNTETNH